MTTLTVPTVTNTAAKSQLARLMATENITVEFDAKAETASFNMESRTLILPVWKDLSTDALDMLIGHEVSHALHTPAGRKPLQEACEYIDPDNPMVAKDYINVVEDARIERMIKTRFPGLKRSFATGYRELKDRDIFGLSKLPNGVEGLALIDRINLQYKIGWLMEVPFSAEELPLAQRVAKTITWEDVVTLSKEIYDLARKQGEKQQQKSEAGEPQDGEDGAGNGKPQKSEDKKKDEKKSDPVPSKDGDEEGEESDKDDTGSASSEEEDGEESDKGETADEGENDDADKDGNVGGDEKSDADMNADGKQDDSDNENEGDSQGKADKSKSSKNPAPTSQTMQSMEKTLSGMIDTSAPQRWYVDLPEIDSGFVVPQKVVMQSLRNWTKAAIVPERVLTAAYASWKTNNAPAVQVLATEFDRRKAADAHKRTAIAETGSIDPNRLHAYRIAEDIFLQNAYVKDGKNHGIVLLLDMSGSMGGIFHDTMIQLVTLAHFCRRVNVPFTFYGYTDRSDNAIVREPSFKKNNFGADASKTRLFTLLQDGMKMNEFVEASSLLLVSSLIAGASLPATHATNKALHDWQGRTYSPPEWMRLDNTPTNAAMLGMPGLISEFKRVKRVQVANLIVLTDGEPGDCMSDLNAHRYYEVNANALSNAWSKVRTIWRDRKSRKEYAATKVYKNWHSQDEYPLDREGQSSTLMQVVRDRTDAKVICIHLINRRYGAPRAMTIAAQTMPMVKTGVVANDTKANAARQAAAEKFRETFEDNDWVGIPNGMGFDEYFLVRTDTKVEEFDLDKVDMDSKSGLRDLRKTFTKSMAQTRANRPLLTRVAELISKGKK